MQEKLQKNQIKYLEPYWPIKFEVFIFALSSVPNRCWATLEEPESTGTTPEKLLRFWLVRPVEEDDWPVPSPPIEERLVLRLWWPSTLFWNNYQLYLCTLIREIVRDFTEYSLLTPDSGQLHRTSASKQQNQT